MIPEVDVARWSRIAPWPAVEQVEQDLVLSRLMIAFAQHPLLGQELVMRGGTCLHKLWLPRPMRYSEDLDYVRTTAGGVGPLFDAIRDVADDIGFDAVSTAVAQHPKAILRARSTAGMPLRIKVEMNTFERAPARPTTTRPLAVETAWFTGTADVPTFALEELIATKLRAMYQRSKGRDVFDLWLVEYRFGLDPRDVAACFGPYRPAGWSADIAIANVQRKLESRTYLEDLRPLVHDWPEGFDAEAAREVAVRFLMVSE